MHDGNVATVEILDVCCLSVWCSYLIIHCLVISLASDADLASQVHNNLSTGGYANS